MDSYRVVGYRIDTGEACIDERLGESSEEATRDAAAARLRLPDGRIDPGYLLVATLDDEGRVVQRADWFPEAGPFDPDFVLGRAGEPAHTVISARLETEEPVVGEVSAPDPISAVEMAIRYHAQIMGRVNDCEFVVALEGRSVVVRCENWGELSWRDSIPEEFARR